MSLLYMVQVNEYCVMPRTPLFFNPMLSRSQEEFENTKGVIQIRSPKDRQHNGQKDEQRSTNHTH